MGSRALRAGLVAIGLLLGPFIWFRLGLVVAEWFSPGHGIEPETAFVLTATTGAFATLVACRVGQRAGLPYWAGLGILVPALNVWLALFIGWKSYSRISPSA